MIFRASQHRQNIEEHQQQPVIAASPATSFHSAHDGQEESDYGSDLDADDEQLLSELLERIATTSPVSSPPPPPLSSPPPPSGAVPISQVINDAGHEVDYNNNKYDARETLDHDLDDFNHEASQGQWIDIKMERDLDDSSIAPREEPPTIKSEDTDEEKKPIFPDPPTIPNNDHLDTRSPLERFRTPPKKPLSVTDLISPAWCEMQYWYSLTRHGRKRRTPAMKQGSVVHQVLQDQVHRSVAVDVVTREDSWGLRIWNVIHGLKMLRETGMTRELEIWGIIDDVVIIGVIDELSYECPDRVTDAEAQIAKESSSAVDPLQRSLDGYIKAVTRRGGGEPQVKRKIYITDVKTRSSNGPLPKAVAMRPTIMQLLIYHRLLSSLAADEVSADVIFARYNLDSRRRFSDSMIAQVASLEQSHRFNLDDDTRMRDTQEEDEQEEDKDLDTLLAHNSLQQLWTLMRKEYHVTFPLGKDSVGDTLKVEYRRQSDGEILGIKTLVYDEGYLNVYLDDVMSWWKGERATVGVPVEEAYKCRFCEFNEGCEWREGKVEEALQKGRRARVKSVV
ncbi:MAG: hypothetical protein M1823_002160 [Watsoniomyces obsoletus]|nr:MAG: hypothetical protein M1823_002160 [Watsoniomyces obsoletus]